MSAAALSAALTKELGDTRWATPMAALAVRFSGRSLSHVGRAVAPVVETLLATAPDGARWGGYVPKGSDRRRVAKPRPVARRGPLVDALATLSRLPAKATMVYVDDGEGESVVPRSFGLWLVSWTRRSRRFALPAVF